MSTLSADVVTLISQHGLAVVFVNVLLTQLGVPLPAAPTLIVAGALAANGQLSAPAAFGLAFLATSIGDTAWYVGGRYYGRSTLRILCRISLSPDSCVRQTELRFGQWGGLTLVVAKFVPGLSTIAPPLAGAMRNPWPRFLLPNSVGIALWILAPMAAGWIFHEQVDRVLSRMENLGNIALTLLLVLLAAYIALKWWERRRFYKMLRMARISAEELRKLMDSGRRPIVVDVRSRAARESDQRFIPGALALEIEAMEKAIADFPDDEDIIFYCTCPDEASAARAARILIDRGYRRVRPLLGGLDAWAEAGYAIERRRATT
jgi:membrane protein DedA with SNARE-associated domain/rhodanese-related sulfurtransferase